jgi:hypothetical protein
VVKPVHSVTYISSSANIVLCCSRCVGAPLGMILSHRALMGKIEGKKRRMRKISEEKGEKKNRNGQTKKRIEEAHWTCRLHTSYLTPGRHIYVDSSFWYTWRDLLHFHTYTVTLPPQSQIWGVSLQPAFV